MKQFISLLFGLALAAGADGLLARGAHRTHSGTGHHHAGARIAIVTAPLLGSVYRPNYYYPYASPAYLLPPAYLDPTGNVRYYCPDLRDYYPVVARCPSPWQKIAPDGSYLP